MSMSRDECLHDCTCGACGFLSEDPDVDSWFECELPEAHLGPHWDRDHGFLGRPVL